MAFPGPGLRQPILKISRGLARALIKNPQALQREAGMTKYRHTNRDWEMDDAKRDQSNKCSVSGKRMYSSEREATSTARHRLDDRETAPAQLKTYKCLYCGSWHLTSK